ncbi:uncharacterized protein LOC100201907 isoform X1 [Hydra vulgaris]|uniref:uncharacterized protein LOC100201907 isoform X1 n=1 Tax=Hydra vulgaris TaxID=6087 RepID=UPI001F5F8924|nr:uncharacterized protein LOC100201907 isoform X1 [Hydra vulgaris]
MAVCNLLVGLCLFLFSPVLAVSVKKGKQNNLQLLDEINRRQAIPLAVVQVSTLRIFPHQNKKTDDEKTAAPISDLEKRLQNYSPFIKKQAQQDIRLRELGGMLNITESLYNGSIAFAIDNNKTTAVHNNTIHLLQSVVSSENNKINTVSLSQVSNKTIEKKNKTITIPIMVLTPDLRNTYAQTNKLYNDQLSQNGSIVVLSEIKNNTKHVAIILSNIKNNTNNDSMALSTDIKNDSSNAYKNLSNAEVFNVLENKENLQTKVKTSDLMHSLPSQFTNIYHLNRLDFNNSSNNSKQEVRIKEITEEQGVLVGPLDTLPNYPNGNGPQDKKLKDLGTPGKTGLGSSNTKKEKKLNKEVKVRRKRQLYNFRGPGMHMPWDYAIDSEQFENNGNINEQNEFFVPTSPKQNIFLKNLYDSSTNVFNNLARDSVARNQWLPNSYFFNSETPKQNYNQLLEHEATMVDKHTSPIIGTFYNTENLMHRTNQPKFHSPLIVDEDASDENELQGSFQKTYIPNNKFNLGPNTFTNDFGTNINDGSYTTLENYNVRPNPRDQIIETFLNNYDQETKKMANFYKQQAIKNSIDFSRINPESLTDPEVNLNQYRSDQFGDSYFNTKVSHEREYPDATFYQDQRRDLLQRRTEKPFELDIRAKLQPNYFPPYNFPARYLSNPSINKGTEFLSNPYPYKRTIESIQPSLLSSLRQENLLSNNFLRGNVLTSQHAVALNLVLPTSYEGDFFIGDKQPRNDITNQQGVVMLMVKTPVKEDDENEKVLIEHKELTHDGITRSSNNISNDEGDFSINLKKAADFVLTNAVSQGNITVKQRDAIERKLNIILEKRYKNKTRVEMSAMTRENIPRICEDTISDCAQLKIGGVCPFMTTFMKGTCTKTCSDCSPSQGLLYETVRGFIKHPDYIDEYRTFRGTQRSLIETVSQRKFTIKTLKIPDDPVMYLTFEYTNQDGVIEDSSLNKNNALLEKGASLSPRVLGTCGKAVELNEGSVTWSGEEFKRKPDVAISIAMYVKVKKSGVINWFANGKTGDKKFYAKTKKTVVPAKIWTHVAGTYDSDSGLARIYINGELEQEQTQRKGEKLSKDWLVNGIGTGFGDDSLHYADEVLIYDRALTQSEIKMLFNRCTFNRMILHFGFQKGNKTSISDQSGLDNDAILVGGARQKEDGEKCGYCLDLTNGPDPAMKIEQIAVKKLPRTKISIALWINLNSTNGIHNIFTTESSEGNIGYRLQVVNGRVRWAIGTDTVPVLFDHMTESQVISEGLWTHIVTTYNNENGIVKIYVNSKEKLKEFVPDERREFLPTNWDNDASIGDRTFRGYIDEFIMYNWDLDSSEALYVRNYCADRPKLVRFTVRVPLTKKTVVPHSIDNNLEMEDKQKLIPYRNEFVNTRTLEQPSLKTSKFEQNNDQKNFKNNFSKTLHSKRVSLQNVAALNNLQKNYKKGFIYRNKDMKKPFLEKKLIELKEKIK